jgi:hypothetical protein
MANKNFAQLAWDMASCHERDRFETLENGTKWVWLEAVMTLHFAADHPPFHFDSLALLVNLTDAALQYHIDALVSRGLLRRDEAGDITLPSELKISPAHRGAKIMLRRAPPALVAVGTNA